MTAKNSTKPSILYRGERNSFIQENGRLAFPKNGEELADLQQWAMDNDSREITFDYDKNNINDDKDFYSLAYKHADSTNPRNSKNYLACTTHIDIAKKFATSDLSGLMREAGTIFKIDCIQLEKSAQFTVRKNPNPNYEDEHEFGIHSLQNAPAIPETAILEEIKVTADGEVCEVIKKHN